MKKRTGRKNTKMTARILALLVCAAFIALLTAGCGKGDSGGGTGADGVDIDLTKMSSTMIFAEVYNIVNTPDDYIGKTIRMDGFFAPYEEKIDGNQRTVLACVVPDATACCSQGLEFVLNEDDPMLQDLPETGAKIIVTGVFDVYEKFGLPYGQLLNANMQQKGWKLGK
ncbi:MAG: hypothetical protein J6I56_06070 [Lachnospiraceae bacterium]|nr:hypothetical protein [Lachnospiraceae bacterium]